MRPRHPLDLGRHARLDAAELLQWMQSHAVMRWDPRHGKYPHGRQLADFPKQVKPEGTWERNLKRYWRLATSYLRLFCSDSHMLRWSHILMNWGARVNLTLRTCYMIIEAHVRASILISSEIWSTQGVPRYGILNLHDIFLARWKISHFVECSS